MFLYKKVRRFSQYSLLACTLLLITIPPCECNFRLCGFRLTLTLTAICKNQVCGGFVESVQTDPMESPFMPLVKRAPALTMGPVGIYPSSMKRSGIATECCEKRCSLSYLKTYCCSSMMQAIKNGENT
uniref:Insulin-like domain-containing protein n=1 Tax=Acrobeloides nanus TaxID=290746 RepID=A0A914DL19_9BILA